MFRGIPQGCNTICSKLLKFMKFSSKFSEVFLVVFFFKFSNVQETLGVGLNAPTP